MDVKEIVKKMLAQGMNPAQIKQSLTELGFENADALVDSCLPKKPSAPISSTATAPAAKPTPMRSPLSEEVFEEEPEKPEEAPEEHSLFDSPTPPQPKPAPKPQAPTTAISPPAAQETQADEEPPQLSITSITDEGEKEVDIRQMLEKEAASPTTTLTAREERGIKTKLDDAVALLKALQQLNKDILATNREILLRLKK